MSRRDHFHSSSIITVQALSYQHPGAATPIFDQLDLNFTQGFTGIVGANGSGKSTLLHLLCGRLAPDSGRVIGADNLVHCEQRTDTPPAELADFLNDPDGTSYALRGRMGVTEESITRWASLSHGERKRAQIATALWQSPDALSIDEPTNHIDQAARDVLVQSLKRFQGIGIIVSHDRDLLDELCTRTIWLDGHSTSTYEGGYSQAKAQRDAERDSQIRERANAQHEQRRLSSEINRRREKASRANKERSKSGISHKDHDAKSKIDAARLTGKDGKAGRLLSQLSGRKEQVDSKLAATHITKERSINIWLDTANTHRNTLFDIPATELAMGDAAKLTTPHLLMQPQDRIAITGANGAGKSTLLKAIVDQISMPQDRLIYLPQEISATRSRRLLEEVRALPNDALGHVMTIVSRLGSDPKALLQSEQPSPGEVRKLMLALGMAKQPWLIVMDEPTNHLDLPSIEALELALQDCPCGLLLVSHDERFLNTLVNTHWELRRDDQGEPTATLTIR